MSEKGPLFDPGAGGTPPRKPNPSTEQAIKMVDWLFARGHGYTTKPTDDPGTTERGGVRGMHDGEEHEG